MVFVAAATVGGLLGDPVVESVGVPHPDLWDLERRITLTLINTFAIRMAAVFIFSTTTIGMRTGFLPRWLVIVGFVSGTVLLFGVNISAWMNLVLPIWALVLSVDILIKSGKIERARPLSADDRPLDVSRQ